MHNEIEILCVIIENSIVATDHTLRILASLFQIRIKFYLTSSNDSNIALRLDHFPIQFSF